MTDVDSAVYRGISFTREEVLEAMKSFDDQERASFPLSRWRVYAVEHGGKRYPPKQLLRLVTKKQVDGGGPRINSLFERLGFRMMIPMLDLAYRTLRLPKCRFTYTRTSMHPGRCRRIGNPSRRAQSSTQCAIR